MRNKTTYKLILLTAAFSFWYANSRAQVSQEVKNSFNLYRQTALEEKVYLHTDKTTYLPGEIVWFKIYCVDGTTHKPLNVSRVVYADVLDANQTAIMQAKIAMTNGVGSGSLYIPVSVTNGNYKLRAYTSWMKNFSPEYYFGKMLTIINPLKSPDVAAKAGTLNYDIQFFPEGGNLVAGAATKVAFKAVGDNGKGVTVTGAIVNQRADTVARFSTLKFGIGSFSFTPATNSFYKAVVKIGGNTITKELPAIEQQGYAMALTNNSGQLDVAVTVKGSTDGNVYLFAHSGQVIKAAESAPVTNGVAHFTIAASSLNAGISHLTIFNEAKQPVCERLFFKRPSQQLFIDAAADQNQYTSRKKVNIDVSAKDAGGKVSDASLSMSVYRVDSLQSADKMEIFSYLWLGSDLRGFIESPDYYFANANAETDAALDNLMLSQGWRKFQWSRLLENKAPSFTFLPELYGHIVTAKVINTITNTPAKDIVTYFGIPGKRVQLYASKSDTLGRVLYNTNDFYGPSEIVVQTNTQVDSNYRIDVQSPFSEQYSKTTLPKLSLAPAVKSALEDHSLSVQVSNIYSATKIKRFFVPNADTTAFYYKPYKSYKLDDFTRFTTMEEVLREYVSEVNIVRRQDHFHIKVLNDQGFLDGDPMVMLDGVPVFNIDKVFNIDPLKVRRLEVIRDKYYWGPSVEEGILSFTTYKGDLGGVDLDPRAVVVDYEGLQLQREFYSPVYGTDADAASRIPDFRNVLYWSPDVVAKGKNSVSFYTSDQPGTYIGVVQGLNSNGDAASKYFTFEVKK